VSPDISDLNKSSMACISAVVGTSGHLEPAAVLLASDSDGVSATLYIQVAVKLFKSAHCQLVHYRKSSPVKKKQRLTE
jgi:hypothetical protein